MDHTKEKRSHQSKFVKQLCYYIIVFTLQMRSAQFQSISKKYSHLFFQLDNSDPSKDHSWRDHHYDWHWGIFSWPHILHCLGNAGNWLGCLRSVSDLQHPLLRSPSFRGDSDYTLICLQSFLLQVSLFNITEKLVVAVFGYEINLVDRSTTGQGRNMFYIFILIQFWFI